MEFREDARRPWRMWVLRVSPKTKSLNVLPVHARDKAMGVETIPEMAERYGALAAINGGYFAYGTYSGISKNNFVLDGRILGTWVDRSAFVLCEEKRGVEHGAVAMTRFEGEVRAGSSEVWHLDGINRERGAKELIWYTSDLGPKTLTSGGVEVALDRDGKVLTLSTEGNSAIPPDGSILSGAERAGEWLRRVGIPGRKFEVRTKMEDDAGCKAVDVVGAGPRIVRAGKPDLSEKGFAHALVRHPRTVAAIDRQGGLIFAVVDGRRLNSVGMTLEELAKLMLDLGAVEAVNLDGGGSSTMWAQGKVWNTPSDGRPRKVSDGLLVFSLANWEQLRTLLNRWGPDVIQAETKQRLLATAGNRRAFLRELNRGGMTHTAARILREALEGLD
jgi:hypothetical protein